MQRGELILRDFSCNPSYISGKPTMTSFVGRNHIIFFQKLFLRGGPLLRPGKTYYGQKVGFTHANFVGRLLKLFKQTQTKYCVICNGLFYFQKFVTCLQILNRFLLGFCLEILKILCRPTKLTSVNPAKD